ncbi:MAG: hypothetical protein EVA36_00275 [Flavobacteriales bacterium]|nr:MAG: hypothetical protein EVA36_00275 [Flavobacteriales bacterium]
MKKLVFLRHAKSSWDYHVDDSDRPLSLKGISDINRISLKNINFFKKFQIFLTSPANRAFHTATILTRNVFNTYKNLRVIEELYSFNYKNVIDYVYKLDNKYSNVVLVGHNPAFSIAAEHLSEIPPPELKTSDWIMLEFKQNNWSKINLGSYTYESKKS